MPAIHRIARTIDRINDRVGRTVAWIALAMVLVQFLVVLLRYVFGIGFVQLQESMVYMHALLFMLGAGYTLLRDAHVRVDVFYRDAADRKKALVNLCGVLFLLAPLCGLVLYVGWPYVEAAWAVREGSREASGIQAVYLLKSAILIFAVLVLAQGVSLALHSLLVLTGRQTFMPRAEETVDEKL